MSAHYPFRGNVYESIAWLLPVTGECGAAGVENVYALDILIEALMGMREQRNIGIDLFRLIKNTFYRIFNSPVMSVGEKHLDITDLFDIEIGTG